MNRPATVSSIDTSRYLLPSSAATALARGDISAATRLLREARGISWQQASALIQSHASAEPTYLLREDGSNWKVPVSVQVALAHNDSAAAAALLETAGGVDRKEALDAVAWLCLHRVAAGAGAATAGDAAQPLVERPVDQRVLWALVAAGVATGIAIGGWWALSRVRGDR